MAYTFKGEKIKRQYVVFENQDKKLQDWADKIADLDKSGVLRIIIELGLVEFEESRITAQLVEGSLWRKSGGSIIPERRKKHG